MRNPRLSKQSLCIVQPGANIRYLDENTHVVQGINRIVNGDFFLSASALSRYHTVNCVTCAHSHTPFERWRWWLIHRTQRTPMLHILNVVVCSHEWMRFPVHMKNAWQSDLSIDQQNYARVPRERLHQDAHCNASECYFSVNTKLVRNFIFFHLLYSSAGKMLRYKIWFLFHLFVSFVSDPYVPLKWF